MILFVGLSLFSIIDDPGSGHAQEPTEPALCLETAEPGLSRIKHVLRDSNPIVVEWREEVGLDRASPDSLTHITMDEALCSELQAAAATHFDGNRIPVGSTLNFFRTEDRFVVTEEFSDVSFGYSFIIVIQETGEGLEPVGPSLAD